MTHLCHVLIQETQSKHGEGGEQQIVQSLQPVIIEPLSRERSIQIEPELHKGENCILVEKVPTEICMNIYLSSIQAVGYLRY